jgi:hypothetical protein
VRKFLAGLLVGLFLSTVVVAASPAMAAQVIKLVVNGKEVKSDVPVQMIDGRVMAPARALSEALGAKVEWDQATGTVRVTSKDWQAQTLDGSEEWITPRSFEDQATRMGSDGYNVTIEANGITLIISTDAPEVSAVASNGVMVRGKVVNSRLYLNAADLRAAGLLK